MRGLEDYKELFERLQKELDKAAVELSVTDMISLLESTLQTDSAGTV